MSKHIASDPEPIEPIDLSEVIVIRDDDPLAEPRTEFIEANDADNEPL